MTLLRRLASVLRWILQRRKAERELADELQVFIDMSASQKIRDGVPPAEARRLASLELGGVEQVSERVRTDRHGGLLDQAGHDLRHAIRMFRKQPGFSIVVVMTLALAIGANTAIFSLIDALMLRWLPVHNPQELVQVKLGAPQATGASDAFSYPIASWLAQRDDIFIAAAGFSGYSFDVGRAGSDTPERVSGVVVTGDYYRTLGLNPAAGRLLTNDDDKTGAPLVAVMSYSYWQRQFGGQPRAVGRNVAVNGVPVTLVGVSPRGFDGANVGQAADLTMAMAAIPQISPQSAPLLGSGNFWIRVLARPRPDVSAPEVGARLNAAWQQNSEQLIAPHWPPTRRKEMAASVLSFEPGGTGRSYLRDMYRTPLFVLMGMVAVVLLIACANVASMLLARASARRREMSVRLAMGAGRRRIIGQLLIESMLLSLAGAALGVGLSQLTSRFLVNTLSTAPGTVVFDLTLNWHVLAFTTAIAIATGLLFGLAPAFHATALAPSTVLKVDGRMSPSTTRLLPSLVSVQVALTLVLLIAASLLVQTLGNLQRLDPGFNRQGVLLVDLEGRPTAVPSQLLAEVQRVPGVLAASLSTHTPLSGAWWSEPAVPQGQKLPENDTALFVGAGPRFFETMQTPLLSGRDFSDRDSTGSGAVAVINEAYATHFFPNQNPIGRHLLARVRGKLSDLEIVGLVKNVNAVALRRPPRSTVYVSYAQLTGDLPTTIEIRVGGSVGETAAAIQKLLQSRLGGAPVYVRPLSAQVEAGMLQERLLATLASGFGLLALALACIGLYGLLAYRVAGRTKEIGIRMALGAERGRVIAMVLRSAVGLVLAGIAVGLPAAWAASRWIEVLLFRLKPNDPATLGGASLLLIAVSLLAAYLPARHASRVDPMSAVRHE